MQPDLSAAVRRNEVVVDTTTQHCTVDGVDHRATIGHWMFYLPDTGEKFCHAREGSIDCIHATRPDAEMLRRDWTNGPYSSADWRAALTTPVERRVAELWVAAVRLWRAGLGPRPLGLTFAKRLVRDGVALGGTAGIVFENVEALPARSECTDADMVAAGVQPDRIRSSIRQQLNGYVIDLSSVVGVQPIDAETEIDGVLMTMHSASNVYFGETAAQYEAERSSDPIWRAETETIAPALLDLFSRGDRVLDVAAGTGRWLDTYRRAGTHPTLVDISPDMLATAARRARDLTYEIAVVTGNVIEMDALPSCDWLVSTRFFNWIPLTDIATILRRAVASGIRQFAFTARCLDETATPAEHELSHAHWNARNDAVLNGASKKGLYHLHSTAAIRRLVEELGLQVSQQHVIERVRGDVYSLFIVMPLPVAEA